MAFQLPATIAVRFLGPRLMFSLITVGFGVITLVSFSSFSYSQPALANKLIVYRFYHYLATDGCFENPTRYDTKCCFPGVKLLD